jgi:hypothetical protein
VNVTDGAEWGSAVSTGVYVATPLTVNAPLTVSAAESCREPGEGGWGVIGAEIRTKMTNRGGQIQINQTRLEQQRQEILVLLSHDGASKAEDILQGKANSSNFSRNMWTWIVGM